MPILASSAGFDKPDFLKISYFRDDAGMKAFEADPGHSLVENELYPAAVANAVWISAKAHPSMLQAVG